MVRGGTFSGGEFGLSVILEAFDQVSLIGGTYKGSIAAINVKSREATSGDILKTSINDLLGDGFTYSPKMTFTTDSNSGQWMTKTNQNELTVVPGSNDSESDVDINNEKQVDSVSTTNNPKTGDNIIIYILMLVISILGFIGIGINLKKSKIN